MTTAGTEYYDQVAANPANTAADGLEVLSQSYRVIIFQTYNIRLYYYTFISYKIMLFKLMHYSITLLYHIRLCYTN